MKVVRTPSPSPEAQKREKINLFSSPEKIEEIPSVRDARQRDSKKILLRVDARTQVLVSPENNTPEYAEILRLRYKVERKIELRGGRKKSDSCM